MAKITIDAESEGMRADKFLRKHLPRAALSFIYKSIRNGICKVNEKKTKQGYKLKKGDVIDIRIKDDEFNKLTTKEATQQVKKTFDVVYEDEDILIVNKPPFLASQPGTGVEQNNLVNQIKTYLKDNKTKPALANRLDRGTSGIVVAGKNRKAILALYDLFKNKRVEKYYLALVEGTFKEKYGTLHSYLKRTTEKFQHKMLVLQRPAEGAVEAETHYRVLKEADRHSLLKLRITTGKMHQIRAQLASIGHPVVGDVIYGNKEANKRFKKVLRRQFLHACKIRFEHPFAKNIIDVEAQLPKDLRKALKKIKSHDS